jgi:hypothetical protein
VHELIAGKFDERHCRNFAEKLTGERITPKSFDEIAETQGEEI